MPTATSILLTLALLVLAYASPIARFDRGVWTQTKVVEYEEYEGPGDNPAMAMQ